MVDPTLLKTGIMLAALAVGFVAMARYRVSQALVMPLIALAVLGVEGAGAEKMLLDALPHFAPVALIFTAIAVCAHQIHRSGAFAVVGAKFGSFVGHRSLRRPRDVVALVSAFVLLLTWSAAALLHNITAIMIMVPITITVCRSYGLPSRWLLCGALVASNLGGFSTAWGDTPNIIEARVWDLDHSDFVLEILPLNLMCLALIGFAVTVLVDRDAKRGGSTLSATQLAMRGTAFAVTASEVEIDRRLLAGGLVGLLGFIVAQAVSREMELSAAGITILFAVAMDRPKHRLESLQSLGIEVYMTLLSVFLIADALSHSALGSALETAIRATNGAPWAIAASSYAGTLFTEAASWAAAAAPITHDANPTHVGAWALGAGICAGSSSLLTAASAGIILWTQSRRFPGHEVEFRDYLPFGICASLLMLVFYISAITLLDFVGYFS
jgi:Na+/H+ antiporter NhaD/arsenite permease-like protein